MDHTEKNTQTREMGYGCQGSPYCKGNSEILLPSETYQADQTTGWSFFGGEVDLLKSCIKKLLCLMKTLKEKSLFSLLGRYYCVNTLLLLCYLFHLTIVHCKYIMQIQCTLFYVIINQCFQKDCMFTNSFSWQSIKFLLLYLA